MRGDNSHTVRLDVRPRASRAPRFGGGDDLPLGYAGRRDVTWLGAVTAATAGRVGQRCTADAIRNSPDGPRCSSISTSVRCHRISTKAIFR